MAVQTRNTTGFSLPRMSGGSVESWSVQPVEQAYRVTIAFRQDLQRPLGTLTCRCPLFFLVVDGNAAFNRRGLWLAKPALMQQNHPRTLG